MPEILGPMLATATATELDPPPALVAVATPIAFVPRLEIPFPELMAVIEALEEA